MDQIAEEKHRIAMMVELVLYKRLKAFDEDDNLDEKTREEQKREIVDAFVKKCSKTVSFILEVLIAIIPNKIPIKNAKIP